jgi:hypothetical protein
VDSIRRSTVRLVWVGRVWGTTGGRRQRAGSTKAGERVVMSCLKAQLCRKTIV